MTAHDQLGTTVHVGPDAVGAVTGVVLVDAGHAPVLLRVRLFDASGTAFVPRAALDLSPGGLHARSAHVLLQKGEASFLRGSSARMAAGGRRCFGCRTHGYGHRR